MFNSKLRKTAIDNYNATVDRYEKVAKNLGDNTNTLYTIREEALKLVKFVEDRVNQLANAPKEFKAELQKIEFEIKSFNAKQQEIKKAEFEANCGLFSLLGHRPNTCCSR